MKIALFSLLTAVASLSLPAHADIVVPDDLGNEMRLAVPARRIVALAPHLAENLYAAGAGDHLVGTVEYSDFPPAAKAVPRIGNHARIDLEAVAALKPDVVLVWESGNNKAQVERLRGLGLRVFVTQPGSLADIPGEIERLGRLAGTEAIARAAGEALRQRLARLQAANAAKPVVRTFYQIWRAPLTTVGGLQIISDAIRLCGGENVFGHLTQMAPTVTVESVLVADPEAIVATGMGDARPDWLSDWDAWPRLTAVRRGNLFHINPDLMQRHTARLLDGTEQLCARLDTARSRRPAR
ncbi:MAG: cobalamin-binding protein [Betaproteobacteria bacterium]|nr:cobalamin-binding protein [Betaproteobacteria bacterium]